MFWKSFSCSSLNENHEKCNHPLIFVHTNHFIVFMSVTQIYNSLAAAEGCNSVGKTEVRSLNSKYIDKFSNDCYILTH